MTLCLLNDGCNLMFFLRRQVKNIKEKKKNKKKEMIIRADKGSSICQGSEQSFPVFFPPY